MPLAQQESEAIILVFHSVLHVKAVTKVGAQNDLFIKTSGTAALSLESLGPPRQLVTASVRTDALYMAVYSTLHGCLCSSVGCYKSFGPRSLGTSEYPGS